MRCVLALAWQQILTICCFLNEGCGEGLVFGGVIRGQEVLGLIPTIVIIFVGTLISSLSVHKFRKEEPKMGAERIKKSLNKRLRKFLSRLF